jgi:DNA topoisomerase IB
VAKRLGNTKAVSRKCYIHPAILDAYMQGVTIASDDEAAVVAIIARRLKKTA